MKEYITIPDIVKASIIPDENGHLGQKYDTTDFITVNLRLPSVADSVRTIGISTVFPYKKTVRMIS